MFQVRFENAPECSQWKQGLKEHLLHGSWDFSSPALKVHSNQAYIYSISSVLKDTNYLNNFYSQDYLLPPDVQLINPDCVL